MEALVLEITVMNSTLPNTPTTFILALVGLRYRDNTLLVDAKETQTNYEPQFLDAQTYMNYKISPKFNLSFLGNITSNTYNYAPKTRQTNFGTLQNPIALLVFYEGQEQDAYSTYFGALNGSYQVNGNLNLQLIGSSFHTTEQEYFDILAQYKGERTLLFETKLVCIWVFKTRKDKKFKIHLLRNVFPTK